jgi:hypothetical protein
VLPDHVCSVPAGRRNDSQLCATARWVSSPRLTMCLGVMWCGAATRAVTERPPRPATRGRSGEHKLSSHGRASLPPRSLTEPYGLEMHLRTVTNLPSSSAIRKANGLGVVPLRRLGSQGAGPERIGRSVILEHGISPPTAVRKSLAVLHMKSTSCWVPGTVAAGNVSIFLGSNGSSPSWRRPGKACHYRERRPNRP